MLREPDLHLVELAPGVPGSSNVLVDFSRIPAALAKMSKAYVLELVEDWTVTDGSDPRKVVPLDQADRLPPEVFGLIAMRISEALHELRLIPPADPRDH